MNASPIDQALLQKVVDAMPDDGLAETRRRAAARFAGLGGFPSVSQENWKYTNLADIAELSNTWLGGPAHSISNTGPAVDAIVSEISDSIDAAWIVVADGVVHADLPALAGVSIDRAGSTGDPDFAGDDPMTVFNAALLRDGLKIVAIEGASPDKPLGILYVDGPSNAVVQTRLVLEAARDAKLQVIEYSVSAAPGRQFTNAVSELNLAPGSRVDHVRIQARDREHAGVNRVAATLSSAAEFNHNSFDLGGSLTRNDIVAEVAGSDAAVSLNGLYLASGEQHIDNHTSIHHKVGPATSVEEYRGILGGRSQCVFNGKVIVSEGADGTDSSQTNHNLLLSERAEIDTKPELEIYADAVKCAHGATVGQLDRSALFYLRSRGLDAEQARQVLTRAFAAGTLSLLAIDACHDRLAALLDSRLESLVGEA
jgi:Fe-S cluster assembly protein SufD